MAEKKRLFTFRNVVSLSLAVGIPVSLYTALHNRRLERRLPVIKREDLPPKLAKAPVFGVHPKLNYTEGYYADLPTSKWKHAVKEGRSPVEEVSRVFWSTLPIRFEWHLFSFLDMLGVKPFESRIDPSKKTAPSFTKGKSILDGTFVVEKGLEEPDADEIVVSYWLTPNASYTFLGGMYTLSCEKLNDRTIRIWLVSNLALNSPGDVLKADSKVESKWNKLLGNDPQIVNPDKKDDLQSRWFPVGIWFHRLYTRILFDFALREMTMRK